MQVIHREVVLDITVYKYISSTQKHEIYIYIFLHSYHIIIEMYMEGKHFQTAEKNP